MTQAVSLGGLESAHSNPPSESDWLRGEQVTQKWANENESWDFGCNYLGGGTVL